MLGEDDGLKLGYGDFAQTPATKIIIMTAAAYRTVS